MKDLACLQGKRQKKEVRRNEKTPGTAVVYEFVAALACMRSSGIKLGETVCI